MSLATQCQTPDCHLECRVARNGYKHHYCCTSCKFSNGNAHDEKCTRRTATHPVPDDIMIAPWRIQQSVSLFYSMPLGWCKDKGEELLNYLSFFYRHANHIGIDHKVVAEWRQTAVVVGSNQHAAERDVTIHAYPHAQCPHTMRFIDVDSIFQLDARGAGDLQGMTGSPTAVALRLALLEIEYLHLREIAFTCRGGTHRSVACACLLALVFYHRARLCFHTNRVRNEAALWLDSYSQRDRRLQLGWT